MKRIFPFEVSYVPVLLFVVTITLRISLFNSRNLFNDFKSVGFT